MRLLRPRASSAPRAPAVARPETAAPCVPPEGTARPPTLTVVYPLPPTRYGEAIDAHECVWRMNRAPTKGFERHVGKKVRALQRADPSGPS